MIFAPRDRDLLIRTVLGEAGNQSPLGQAAVGQVVLNRLNTGRWGDSVEDVVFAPHQFEPWQTRRDELLAIKADAPEYQRAGSLVDALLAGKVPDPTGGATHFLNPAIVRERRGGGLPSWAAEPVAEIGDHAFYAPEGRAQQAQQKFAQALAQIDESQRRFPPEGGPAMAVNRPPVQPAAAPFAFDPSGVLPSPGNRYVQLLAGNNAAQLNNGTHLGGLAAALQQGLQGFAVGRDARQQTAAQKALVAGLQGDDPAAVAQQLAAMEGNPYAGRLATALMTQQAAAQAAAQQAAQERQAGREDYLFQQQNKQAPPPASVQEYNFAVEQGFPGSYTDFVTAQNKAKGTTVNVGPTGVDYGTPPKDMVWARDPQGNVVLQQGPGGYMAPVAVPVAGGPMQQEQQATERAAQEGRRQRETVANIVVEDINRIKDLVQSATLPTTGALGPWVARIGGTNAANINSLLDTVKSNAAFDKLQAMREASPTGGALGAVSERELGLLQSTIGSLEQSQSQEQFLQNLDRVARVYNEIIHGPGGGQGAAQPPSDPTVLTDEELLRQLGVQ